MLPSVEILIPVYNRRNLILKCVNSALNQTYSNVSVIVSDNHSSDGTWEKLSKIKDNKLKIFKNDNNIGLFENFNKLISYSRKDFSIFLCSDDWLDPYFIEKNLKFFFDHKDLVMVSSASIAFNEKSKKKLIANYLICKKYNFDEVLYDWFLTSFKSGINPFTYPSGIMLKGEVLRKNIFFDKSFGSPADIIFFLDIIKHGKVFFTDYLGANIFIHSNQAHKSFEQDGSLIHSQLKIINKYKTKLIEFNIYKTILIYSCIPVLKILIKNYFNKKSLILFKEYLISIEYKNIKFFYIRLIYSFIIRVYNFIKNNYRF